MPRYSVLLTRDATESCWVTVDAENPAQADDRALEVAGRYGENVDGWEMDDNQHEVYLPSPNSAEVLTKIVEPWNSSADTCKLIKTLVEAYPELDAVFMTIHRADQETNGPDSWAISVDTQFAELTRIATFVTNYPDTALDHIHVEHVKLELGDELVFRGVHVFQTAEAWDRYRFRNKPRPHNT